MQEILELVNMWLHKKSATLQELQSLVGKLNFSSCFHASRVFICRILNWLRLIHGKKSALWRAERVIILFCYFNCNSIIYIFVFISFVTFIILILSLSFYHSNIRLYNKL